MAAVANNSSFAKKAGVPQSVGKDFTTADKGRKFSKGGDTMASKMNPGFMAMMAKKKGAPAKKMAGGGMPMKDGKPAFIGDGKGMKHGGMAMGKVKTAAPSKDGIAEKGKTKGKMVGMKMGGKAC
jgi:hypothetical protein